MYDEAGCRRPPISMKPFLTTTFFAVLALILASAVPLHRRRPMPTSSSFPSGHSASAVAFAAGVSLAMPTTAPVVIPLAAAVAVSRTYVGVHYPSDVLAGSAVGLVMALALSSAPPKI